MKRIDLQAGDYFVLKEDGNPGWYGRVDVVLDDTVYYTAPGNAMLSHFCWDWFEVNQGYTIEVIPNLRNTSVGCLDTNEWDWFWAVSAWAFDANDDRAFFHVEEAMNDIEAMLADSGISHNSMRLYRILEKLKLFKMDELHLYFVGSDKE